MSVYYDKTLHFLGRSQIKPSIVVIGAMDGHSFDDMAAYFSLYRWSGLFIEPIPYQFENLKRYHDSLNYIHSCKYENCAIAEYDGTVEMLTIDTSAIENGLIHKCFGGMSAIYPPKNGLGSEGDAETVRQYGKKIQVPCKTLNTVFTKHDITHIDIIQVDTEGWDWKILKQLDFKRYRPKLIRSEYINLDEKEKQEIIEYFSSKGYIYTYGQDIDFVDRYFWKEING